MPNLEAENPTNAAAYKKWADYFKSVAEQDPITWPSETLVRFFKGNYVPGMDKDFKGKKVMEVGFGDGNNLNFFGTLGMELSGAEVAQEICDIATKRLTRMGYNPVLKAGTNRNLPFPDNSFDYLVSWNCIHYESNEPDMLAAIAEYQRVLKPGGRFFISTAGPENKILRDSKSLGGHRYQIGREDDFRKGQIFFYFDTAEEVQRYWSAKFKSVLVGRVHDHLFLDEHLDWFVATGIKP